MYEFRRCLRFQGRSSLYEKSKCHIYKEEELANGLHGQADAQRKVGAHWRKHKVLIDREIFAHGKAELGFDPVVQSQLFIFDGIGACGGRSVSGATNFQITGQKKRGQSFRQHIFGTNSDHALIKRHAMVFIVV